MKWADLSQSDYGVSLLNDCKYGYDIKGNVMRLTLLRSPLWPDPMANRGESYITYSLYPHKGDWRDGNTVRRAYELNYPLMSKVVSNHKGELSLSHSFFKALPNNIVMTVIKKAEDSDDLILRLYESFGQDTKAKMVLPKKPKDVVLTNLMEEVIPSSEITINDNIIEVPIDKNVIMTVKVTF